MKSLLMVVLLSCIGCVHGTGVVNKAAPAEPWSEKDAKNTGAHLSTSLLASPWLRDYGKKNKGEKPTVAFGVFENRTDGALDTSALQQAIKAELAKSGKIKVMPTTKGAAFLMQGNITESVHTMRDVQTRTYQTTGTLVQVSNSEFAWTAKFEIKKTSRK